MKLFLEVKLIGYFHATPADHKLEAFIHFLHNTSSGNSLQLQPNFDCIGENLPRPLSNLGLIPFVIKQF
jgi:hypothetical protein